jgi:glycosyltransferase involved in cell wall biosynthesis
VHRPRLLRCTVDKLGRVSRVPLEDGSMKRARVVCFVNHTAVTGGAEFALNRLVAGMDRSRWHPVVVFGEEGPAVELFRKRGVETYVLPIPAHLGKTRRNGLAGSAWMRPKAAWDACAYIAQLASFFRTRAVDIVHTNSMKAHVLGGFAARLCRIPLAWHLRDCLHPAHLPQTALRAMRTLAQTLPNRVITVSKSVAEDALGPKADQRAEVIYDGLDPECFENPAQPPSAYPPPVWRVGIVGRFAPWKGQHVFLEAAAKLIQRGHRVHFELLGAALFGEDAYAHRLQQFVEATALQAHVSFSGFVSDVPQRIRSWHVLVHASTAPDPCPNVVLEAMAAGIPVVGADGGGVPELLEGGRCGGLFPMDDPSALCQQLETIFAQPLLRAEYALKGRQRALNLFYSDRVASEVSAVWDAISDPNVYRRRRWAWMEDDCVPVQRDSATTGGRDFAEPATIQKSEEAMPATQ